MESTPGIIIPLEKAKSYNLKEIGSKTKNLSLILNQGFKVPEGFCISTTAYSEFIKYNKLFHIIDIEFSKKPFEELRWEEIWDASLRIRSAFLKSKIPPSIKSQILNQLQKFDGSEKFSVRSSSPAEDSEKTSFAGIHESYVNVSSAEKILESVKLVWASLWSDRAILYRDELKLNSINSSIAVLVQKMEIQPVSGLAFSQNPTGKKNELVLEVVNGLLADLVDNVKEGEKWVINKDNHKIINHIKPDTLKTSLLNHSDLKFLINVVKILEKNYGYGVDIEWTGKGKNFTVLQVRPITNIEDENKERKWYLTLTPKFERLKQIANKVEHNLIPQLEADGIKLSKKSPDGLNRRELAFELKKRAKLYFKWKKVYRDDFIPFAHGIRNFGTYYNDLVKPEDPYEFMELLKTRDLLASERNHEIKELAKILKQDDNLNSNINQFLDDKISGSSLIESIPKLKKSNYSNQFSKKFMHLWKEYMDLAYENISLQDHPELILKNIAELSKSHEKNNSLIESEDQNRWGKNSGKNKTIYLEKLYHVAGISRKEEVDEVLRIGRLSWKLRDDDNILLGKIENQVLIFLNYAADILIKENRLDPDIKLHPEDWEAVYSGLIHKPSDEFNIESNIITIKNKKTSSPEKPISQFKPRQLIGQPSSPGIATGKARVIKTFEDFSKLKLGDILICDAMEPEMTFLVSLSSGIVERRGGMLVHSSIIAREMGIPAVNGVSKVSDLIHDDDLVTVNGYLGIVVIGEAEFNLELNQALKSRSD